MVSRKNPNVMWFCEVAMCSSRASYSLARRIVKTLMEIPDVSAGGCFSRTLVYCEVIGDLNIGHLFNFG